MTSVAPAPFGRSQRTSARQRTISVAETTVLSPLPKDLTYVCTQLITNFSIAKECKGEGSTPLLTTQHPSECLERLDDLAGPLCDFVFAERSLARLKQSP